MGPVLVVSHDSIRGCVRPSVGWSVGWSVCWSVMLLSAGRNEPANDLFCVYELVSKSLVKKTIFNDYFVKIFLTIFVKGLAMRGIYQSMDIRTNR